MSDRRSLWMSRLDVFQRAIWDSYEMIMRIEERAESLEHMRASDDGMPGFVARPLPLAPIEIVLA